MCLEKYKYLIHIHMWCRYMEINEYNDQSPFSLEIQMNEKQTQK
jgi:hypothetical protein